MNATLIGKLLVFFNLVLSLMFAAMALGIYTNRIDWPGTASPTVPGEKVLGEYGERKEAIQKQEQVASTALTRWLDMTEKLDRLELSRPAQELKPDDVVSRPEAVAWYADMLNILKTGTDRSGKPNKVTALPRDKDGKLVLKRDPATQLLALATGQPVPGPTNQALQSESEYKAALEKTEQAIAATRARGLEANEAEKILTIQINGIAGMQKGLRALIDEVEAAGRSALAELEYLRPFRYNRQAEGELLDKRQRALEARREELKKALGAGMP